MINKILITIFCIGTFFSVAISSSGCYDDMTGAFTSVTNPVTGSSLNLSCEEVINSLQILCTAGSFTYSGISIDIGRLVSEECPLSCNECQSHFSEPTNSYLPMNIYITSAELVGINLEEGDEIGVFDADNGCVGRGVVRQTITMNSTLEIIVPTDDTETSEKDGFTNGNAISFRIWDASANTEYPWITAEFITGSTLSSVFASQGTAFVALSLANLSNNDGGIYPTSFHIQDAYPNPFNPSVHIAYEISENSNIQLDIFDISGKKIESLINKFQTSGHYEIEWNASSRSSGVYIISLQIDDYKEVKKITYLK